MLGLLPPSPGPWLLLIAALLLPRPTAACETVVLTAHVSDDFFANKLAFTVLLNFPLTTLEQRLMEGEEWSRRQWAETRLASRFSKRVPAEVQLELARVGADADPGSGSCGGPQPAVKLNPAPATPAPSSRIAALRVRRAERARSDLITLSAPFWEDTVPLLALGGSVGAARHRSFYSQ